ncbi:hypothetical protein [Nostoc sp.]
MADGVAIVVFAGIVYFNRNKLANIRNFSNRTFLSLSDPVKVFIFILITDIFVGFHSAEGWEVLLEGIGHHFGLPESKVVIYTFIATVPVMMDSIPLLSLSENICHFWILELLYSKRSRDSFLITNTRPIFS